MILRTSRALLTAVVATAVCLPVSAHAVAVTTPPQPDPTVVSPDATTAPADTSAPGAGTWTEPTQSIDAPVREVLAEAPRSRPVAVVAVTAGPNGPEVHRTVAPDRADAAQTVAEWQDHPDALAVGLDSPVQVAGTVATDDPRNGDQWSFGATDPTPAWSVTRGEGVTVAVVDTGIDGTHEDLQGRLVPGKTFLRNSNPAADTDTSGHGTHVAGVIAANANNRVGIAGWAPGAKVMPIKVLDESGVGYLGDVAAGIRWAVNNGAHVVNLSLAAPSADVVKPAIEYARSKQVVLVAAAGNGGGDAVAFPAAFPGVIGVSSYSPDFTRPPFANTGRNVDLVAPGDDVLSTVPLRSGSRYARYDGTSQASPHVAAVAALLLSLNRSADVAQVLSSTARDLGPAGRDVLFGAGAVDPVAAVAALSGCPNCLSVPGATPDDPRTTLKRQSVVMPTRVRVGETVRLPRSTQQGQRLVWHSKDRSSCRVATPGRRVVLRGIEKGTCLVTTRATGTERLEQLRERATVRVLGAR